MSVDITTVPDVYYPCVENGKYFDRHQTLKNGGFSRKYKNGLKCPCSCHETVFKKYATFKKHCSGKRHIDYLKSLNLEYKDPVKRAIDAERDLKQSKIIITSLSNELERLKLRIDFLETQLKCPVGNLISFE